MAAPNRSLVVSEPLLQHVPQYRAGIHYVSAPIDRLAESILYYLENGAERSRIVENVYHLLTSTLTMNNSLRIILNEVSQEQGLAAQ